MIESIEIENLRGIAHGKLDGLTPLTILVGPNGSGKSTILDALRIVASENPQNAVQSATARQVNINQHIQGRWLVHQPGSHPPRLRVGIQRLDGSQIISELFLTVSNYGQVECSRGPGSSAGLDGTVRFIDARSEFTSNRLNDAYSEARKAGLKKELNEAVRLLLPDLDTLDILTEDGQPVLFADYGTHAIPVALSGDGVHALIRLSIELALEPGSVVLLEEPETHLHPAAIRLAAKAILGAVRRGTQVILTTHDLELIDALLDAIQRPEELEKLSLFWVKLNQGKLRSIRIPGPDVDFERKQIEKDLR